MKEENNNHESQQINDQNQEQNQAPIIQDQGQKQESLNQVQAENLCVKLAKDIVKYYNAAKSKEDFIAQFNLSADQQETLGKLYKALRAVYGDKEIEDNCAKIAADVTWV